MDDLMTTEACTMPTAQRPTRLGEFEDLFAAAARTVTRDGDAIRIHLVGDGGLRDTVRDLARRETDCCSFFTFSFEGTDDDLVLGVAVPPERRDILDALAARAEERCS
jgi:hypothetical protein